MENKLKLLWKIPLIKNKRQKHPKAKQVHYIRRYSECNMNKYQIFFFKTNNNFLLFYFILV